MLVNLTPKRLASRGASRLNLQLEPGWWRWWTKKAALILESQAYEEKPYTHREDLASSPGREHLQHHTVYKYVDRGKGKMDEDIYAH